MSNSTALGVDTSVPTTSGAVTVAVAVGSLLPAGAPSPSFRYPVAVRVAVGVEAAPAGPRLEDGETAVALADDEAVGYPQRRLAVGVPVTACDDAAALQYPEVGFAVGTGPLAVEPLAHRVHERVAVAVDADVERVPALDAHLREAAVAGLLVDGRPARNRVGGRTAETGDVAVGAHERPLAVGAVADRDAGDRPRVSRDAVAGVAFDAHAAVARGRGEREGAVLDGGAGGLGARQPRHRLVAVHVVDEQGVVGFQQRDHLAAPSAAGGLVERDGAVAGEHAECVGHGPVWSRSPV